MDRQSKPDTIDWKILKELQGDGRVSNVDLAGRVGLSPPPTLRRVQALEQEGYITGYRARLAAEKLGYGVQVIALVGLKSQAENEMKDFERRVAGWPIVRECYAISGVADYLLKCVGRDLQSIQGFLMGALALLADMMGRHRRISEELLYLARRRIYSSKRTAKAALADAADESPTANGLPIMREVEPGDPVEEKVGATNR